MEDERDSLVQALQEALERSSEDTTTTHLDGQAGKGDKPTASVLLPNNLRCILTASLSHEEGMVFNRHDIVSRGNRSR